MLTSVKEKNFDVIGLQEVKFSHSPIFEPDFFLITNPDSTRGGTAFLVRKETKITAVKIGADGRILYLQLKGICLINVYAPAGRSNCEERNLFFQTELPPFLRMAKEMCLLFGDFNTIENLQDRNQINEENQTRTHKFRAIYSYLTRHLSTVDMSDVWRNLKPKDAGHTYFHRGGSSRLDRFYVAKEKLNLINSIESIALPFTDHKCVHLSISTQPISSPSHVKSKEKQILWKLNTETIKEDYQVRINKFLLNAENHPLKNADICLWWDDILKPGIKKISVDYCRQRAQLRKSTCLLYENCLTDLSNTLGDTNNREHWKEYCSLRKLSNFYIKDQCQGSAIRSREEFDETSV